MLQDDWMLQRYLLSIKTPSNAGDKKKTLFFKKIARLSKRYIRSDYNEKTYQDEL